MCLTKRRERSLNNMDKDALFERIRKLNAAVIFGVIYLGYSLFFFLYSFNYQYYTPHGPGPGLFPRWFSSISIFLSIIYIIQSATKNKFPLGESFPPLKEFINVLLIFISCMIFIFLLNVVGFNIASMLLLFTVFVRQYKLWQAILLSIVISVICFAVFKIAFMVPLPVNRFGF